ncbi:proline iminopeptidase [Alloscardovia macacae]|uniref:Proline iminopeptidase n=1 Tax=Alloscardovia macacae TaxID=1160091 RepID=A0A1Y2SZI0_9BIFI|nr:alpha/beta fold hydrolase [Alloscardovia macacae]OTA27122.1 proline iminopeptidase [Alloscardovia macacae]OTA29686.1 proline iminopeptidase [Alloscardovia macacae]
MTDISRYYVPGLHVDDHVINVPLHWQWKDGAAEPEQESFAGEQIQLFYRVVTSAQNTKRELPLLLFLQGGPGGMGPRPMSADSIPWLAEAVKHFRVVLIDQRGTGRSSRVDASSITRRTKNGETARQTADFLKNFLADSIIHDCEYLRLTQFGGQKWATLGQSYGGFLTMAYLSLFPHALAVSFVTGGIPHIPMNPREVYEHTVPRMIAKTQQYYARYPEDEAKLAHIADIIASGGVQLPNGDPVSVRRLQMLGGDFGMKPSFERMHWTVDTAFASPAEEASGILTDGFLMELFARTTSYGDELYWALQEFIYANENMSPISWAANQVLRDTPAMNEDARPLMLIGEAALPEMFEQDAALRPFAPAMDLLMADTSWGKVYDEEKLAENTVPLRAAVYFDDMYVDSGLQLDTLSRVGNSHAWVTNEFEHDGARSGNVFQHLYEEALSLGDLENLL